MPETIGWGDPAAVQAATAGMPGRDAIATRLAREIPWLGEDAARTVAGIALLALRDAGLAVVPAEAARWASTTLRAVRLEAADRTTGHQVVRDISELTKISGGCPGLQAGEESGFPRSGAGEADSPPGEPASPAAVPSAVSNR